jgi:competence protein ComEA
MEAEPSKSEAAGQVVPDWLLGVESDQTATERFPVFQAEEEMTFESVPEASSKIDLNSATVEQLAELPGIGEFLAENIVAYREIYGPYSSLDDLNNIVGIEPSTIDGLRGRVEFHEVEAAAQTGEVGITDWLKNVQVEDEGTKLEETFVDEQASGDLPSWLAGLDEVQAQPEPVTGVDDDLPEWLRAVDEQEPVGTEPTAPTDWRPADVPTAFAEEPSVPVAEPEPEVEETHVQAAPPVTPEPEPEPVEPETPVEPQPEPYVEPVTTVRSGMTGMLSTAQDPLLTGAQLELARGNVSGALESYERLIRKARMLDEIIFDLREALYRYPVDVSIMQALGDAYMRANRLQDALDAYTKAEELLR